MWLQTEKRLAACISVLSRGRRDQNKGWKVWFVVKGTHDFMLNLEEDIAQCAWLPNTLDTCTDRLKRKHRYLAGMRQLSGQLQCLMALYISELSRSQTNRGSWIYISNLRIELDIKILTRRLKTQILNLKFSSVSFLLLVGQNKCWSNSSFERYCSA